MHLKVLLAVDHLEVIGGSELYATELARALTDRGAIVAILTLRRGPLGARFEADTGIRVFGPNEMLPVQHFAPDIVHSHHLTTFHLLGEVLPGVPRVHGILGVVPALEYPPVTLAEASRVFAVSERAAQRALARAPQVASIEIVRNWFDERHLAEVDPFTVADDGPHRVLVVSQKPSPARDAALEVLEADGFATVTWAGGKHGQREITGKFLKQHDAVVTIGRTVLLAAAVGVPVIVADQEMSDGLLTHDIVDRLARKNFTGRWFRRAITPGHLRDEILRSKHIDREALSRKVRAEYGLSARSQYFLSVYEEVLREWRERPAADPQVRRGEGLVYRDMAVKIAHLERELQEARREVRRQKATPEPR